MTVHADARRRSSAPRWTLFAICAALMVAGIIAAAVAVAAQELQDGQQQPPAAIRSETHAILISVSVRDSGGHAVENLQKSDFTVTDEGKARDIVMFPNESGPELARRRITTADGYFSNQFGEPSSGRATAILIDAVNTTVQDQAFAREQAIKAIQKAAPDESVAVYAMNPDIAVLQDYTTDHDALLAAVRAFQPHQPVWSSTPTSGSRASTYSAENREVQSKPQGAAAGARGRGDPAVRNMNAFFLDQRILATVAALKAIATHMSGASHRNSIIWITAGFPANLDSDQQMLAAIQAINDANVAVYPVDARGLPVGGIDSNIQIMDGIAENTGGVAYTMSNDVAQEIQDAIAAPGYTYLLGFYLSSADLDGKLHRLHVSVDRPGVSLNYRSGYTAYADPNTARADAEPLESELLSPSDSTAIGIDGKVTVQNSPAGKQLHIQLVLDRARLPYAPNTKVTLSQMFVELDAQGRVIGKVTADIKFDMPGEGRKPAYSQTIRDQDGARKLRVVLQDKNSKRTGSLTIPL